MASSQNRGSAGGSKAQQSKDEEKPLWCETCGYPGEAVVILDTKQHVKRNRQTTDLVQKHP